ncbi:lipopolysaccharide transport periplasmic protein LptA [Neisseria musculi]|uniref:Lipopolysaccharide export system protein LptA n=1 Tax=Neisseria musculi TaxID=1815583 RepID=A0A7H1M924_9NEIS|nr:lipopolysaccharide transport periplasmic protein LptA [Neisseria musculi]QNT58139.1 lipopolysaccharide transport periplasmic protein LptA [Neisseria musculi]
MTQKTCKTAALAVLALMAAAPCAFALESDRRQPIQIEADQGSLDQANQVTTFSGNVIIKQGTLNISAGSVRVSRNSKGEQQMNAAGSPVRFSQTLDDGKGIVKGRADNIDYSSATNIVKLTGNARVERGGDVAEGAVITYNTRTEIYTVQGSKAAGGKSGKRVTVVIQPSGAQSQGRKK